MSSGQRAQTLSPHGYREFARVLGGAVKAGRAVRARGAGTKLGWGNPAPAGALNLSTLQLTEASFTETTAVFGAGLALARVHTLLARHGRMLAIDPPGGSQPAAGATIGGVIATADSGPLAHAYGPARLQVIDLLAALSDGTLVRGSDFADGDLPSLLTGSYGTLGAILEVTLVTHPLPAQTLTVAATAGDGTTLAQAARALADSPVGARAIDFAWQQGTGGLLVLLTGTRESPAVAATSALLREAGLRDVTVRGDGDALWARQRAGQRSRDRAVLRVTGPPALLPAVLAAADRGGATVVGRAALGHCYLTLNVNQISAVRTLLPAGCHAVVTDLPQAARGTVEVWGPLDAGALRLMRAVKTRLDPALACNPGVFVGGI